MLRVGLTGGIACGKSLVLRRLRRPGIATIDLDDLSRDVTRPGSERLALIVEAFGDSILEADGSLKRRALATLVFADPKARTRLNAIVHPAVRAEEARLAASLGREAALLVVDGALLLEVGVHLRFDRLAVVHCAREVQVRRLQARDGLDEAGALARIEAQMPLAEKRRYAHYELESSGTTTQTEERADRLADALVALALVPVAPIAVASPRVASCLRHGPHDGSSAAGPMDLLREIALTGRVEMPRVASLAGAPAGEPWHRFESANPLRPAALALPIVLWALLRRGADADFLAYAMASAARASGASVPTAATACAFALILSHVAASGRIGEDLLGLVEEAEGRARRWCGAGPEPAWSAAVAAAVAHPDAPQQARCAARAVGADADMAGALAGLATSAPADVADAEVALLLSALEERAAGL